MDNETAEQAPPEVRQVAARFLPAAEAASLTIQKPPTIGFSGAAVWLLSPADGSPRYVLKQLPAGLPPDQIGWTHLLAQHLARVGVSTQLPLRAGIHPLTQAGHVAIDRQGRLWQCLSYLPGRPIATPTSAEVLAAVTTLATVHRAASEFVQPPPLPRLTGWQTRVLQLEQLAVAGFPRPPAEPAGQADGQAAWPELASISQRANECFFAMGGPQLAARLAAQTFPRPLQPVLRDCWWAHLLFEPAPGGSRVSGIIDLDAAGIDTPAVDLARLLGSWQLEAGDPEISLVERWPAAFDCYVSLCRPAGDFPTDVQLLHDTAVVCGLDRWLHWLFREQRNFADFSRVTCRIQALLRALPAALARLQRVSTAGCQLRRPQLTPQNYDR